MWPGGLVPYWEPFQARPDFAIAGLQGFELTAWDFSNKQPSSHSFRVENFTNEGLQGCSAMVKRFSNLQAGGSSDS